MAATPADVKAINGSTLDDLAIQPFLDAAQCIIDNVSDCITDISASCVDTAQAWLACHLMAVSGVGQSSGAATKEQFKFENYSVTYAVSKSYGEGVLSTMYGSAANDMLNGCLVESSKRNAAIAFGGGVC